MKANKICTRCGTIKPLDMFPFAKDNKDGRLGYCKDCWNVDHREASKKFRLKESSKEQHRIGQALYKQRHPERVEAHRLAYKWKNRLLGSRCESCEAVENLHMHHPDYSKPPEVITLCTPCHELIHHRSLAL